MPYSEKVKFIFTINACINHICPVGKILSSIVTSSTTSSSSSNIYYKNIYNELFSGFFNNNIEIVFWNIFVSLPLHTPWHRPLLAQPGPRREAIHCASLLIAVNQSLARENKMIGLGSDKIDPKVLLLFLKLKH